MIRQGWKQREANAKAKLAERAERRASPAYQEAQRLFAEMREAEERAAESERQRLREERGAPAREVVAKLGEYVPDAREFLELARAIRKLKPDAFASALDHAIARTAGVAREAEKAAEAANLALVHAGMEERRRAKVEEKRQREVERKAAEAAQEAEQAA